MQKWLLGGDEIKINENFSWWNFKEWMLNKVKPFQINFLKLIFWHMKFWEIELSRKCNFQKKLFYRQWNYYKNETLRTLFLTIKFDQLIMS